MLLFCSIHNVCQKKMCIDQIYRENFDCLNVFYFWWQQQVKKKDET